MSLRANGVKPSQAVIVQLEPDQVLAKVFDVPFVPHDRLPDVLRFEVSRRTPFRAGDIYYGFERLDPLLPKPDRISVALVVTPVGNVRAWEALLERCGNSVAQVQAIVSVDDVERVITMSHDGRGSVRRLLSVQAQATLAALLLAAISGAASLCVRVSRLLDESEVATVMVARTRVAADKLSQIEKQAQIVEQNLAVLRDARASTSRIAVLDELSRLIPKDTWLAALNISGEDVSISGYSPNASALIELLNRSPVFSGSRFRSPVMANGRAGSEHFDIVFRLRREPHS